MAGIAILTDSTSDLTPDMLRDHEITVTPLNVQFGNEVFQDQVEITTAQFMERLQHADQLPTTSQPAPGLFEAAYRRLAENHDAILAILISAKLSGTVQSATIASASVASEIRVEIVDSLNASMGLGLQVLRASELASNGVGLEEIARRLRAETSAYHLVFFVDTLEYLKRGGRIGRAASLVGSFIKLKPLLRLDEGQVVPFERTRTKTRAVEGLKDFVRGFPSISKLAVLYSTDRDEAASLADDLGPAVPCDKIYIAQFGPVIGTHVGPGALGVCVYEGESA